MELNGQQVEFEQRLDDGVNPAWVCRQLDATVGDEEVGYIKAAYVPQSNFKAYFPSPGWLEINRASSSERTPSLEGKSDEDLAKFIDQNNRSLRSQRSELEGLNSDTLLEKAKETLEHHNEEGRHRYNAFEEFHVDKPRVDYVKVYDSWKRKGIGTALYEEMAETLGEEDMALYASGLQSDDAVAIWDYLEDQLPVFKEELEHYDRERKYIDLRK